MKWINRLYILFLGIVLSITTGFGVAAFYPQPKQPRYPASLKVNTVPQSCYATPQSQESSECQAILEKQRIQQELDVVTNQQYQDDVDVYENKNAGYTRTSVFLGIVIGAIVALFGITLVRISKLVATGLLLAGVLTAVLTRILIGLASLGASVSSTAGADKTGFIEFGILLVLSVIIVLVGLFSIKDHETIPSPQLPPTPPVTS